MNRKRKRKNKRNHKNYELLNIGRSVNYKQVLLIGPSKPDVYFAGMSYIYTVGHKTVATATLSRTQYSVIHQCGLLESVNIYDNRYRVVHW